VEPQIRFADHQLHSRRELRASERLRTTLPGRLVWRDDRGATRFATVVIRDLSAQGAYVECVHGTPIPLFRLVVLQTERRTAGGEMVPEPFRAGKILSAVFRVAPSIPSTGVPQGYGLRLLVEPTRRREYATMASSRDTGRAAAEATA
jgi:hypothetical protein